MQVKNAKGVYTSIPISEHLTTNALVAVDVMYTPTGVLSIRTNNRSVFSEKFEFDDSYFADVIVTGRDAYEGILDNFTLSF